MPVDIQGGEVLEHAQAVDRRPSSGDAGGRGCTFFAALLNAQRHQSQKMTSVSQINVRIASDRMQVQLATPSPTVQQLKRHLASALSPASNELRVVRKGALLKDSAVLADGDSVTALFSCRGGSACVDSPLTPHTPISQSQFDFSDGDDDADFASLDCLGTHVASMKTLHRLQSSAPKSSAKLFGNRSNLLSSDYADLVLGFTPPKLSAKAAKSSAAARDEQAAAEFQGELAAGQHWGVVEAASGKNFRVRSLLDNRVRACRIKGLLKRHIQINSVVVFEPSIKFGDDDHGDILWRYFEQEIERLQDKGLLPQSDVLWPKPCPAASHTAATGAGDASHKFKQGSKAA